MTLTSFSRLRTRLLLLILVSVAPAFAIVVANSFEQRTRALAEAQRQALELAQSVAARERDLIANSRQLLQSLVHAPEVRVGPPGACRTLLMELRRIHPYYVELFVATPDGEIRCSANTLPHPMNVADRAYFHRALQTRAFAIGDYQVSRISGKPTLALALPVFDDAGRVQSVVALSLDFNWVGESLVVLRLGQRSLVTLVDRLGTLLASMPDQAGQVGKLIPALPASLERVTREGQLTTEAVWLDGVRRITAIVPLFDTTRGNLYVRVGIARDSVSAAAEQQFYRSVALMGLGVLLTMVLGSLASDRLVLRRVRDLTEAVRRLGGGDMAARTSLPPDQGELGRLAQTFDVMAEELQSRQWRIERSSQALRASREKLTRILASVDQVVWSVHAQSGKLIYLNPVAKRIYGRPLSDFLGKDYLRHEAIHPQDRDVVIGRHAKLQAGGTDQFEYRIMRPDGTIRWLDNRVTVACDDDGKPLRLDGIATDITERKLHEERIAHLASRDTLTGLPNLRLLVERLGHAMASAEPRERCLALLVLNVDRLKLVNDSLGYVIGDALLIAMGERLREIVSDKDTVARLGGDEFAILLTSIKGAEGATTVVAKVFDALQRPFSVDGHELHVTVSLGGALFPRDSADPEMLLNHARSAMHRSKQPGGDAFEFYTAELTQEATQRLKLEQALRNALEREEFELHYQPRLDLASGRVTSVEALIRWLHPDLGLISPGRFIPVAEDSGLIVPIGEWVLRAACTQQVAWSRAGQSRVSVAVNLSALQFWHGDVIQMVTRVMRETGIAPEMLELEVTESVVMRDIEETVRALRELRALGVRVAIDDFGTGYSSLNYLRQLPIDKLKIDQSFVRDLATHPEVNEIVQTIIDLAHALRHKVVAEGVETRAQLKFLSARGCDEIQGYLLSRPMPAVEAQRWLRHWEASEEAGNLLIDRSQQENH